jgi:hypothetical protein
MPVLSAYISSTQATFLVVKSASEFSVFHFPFAYSRDLYGHFVPEEGFNRSVIEFVKKQHGIETCDVIVCGDLAPVRLELDTQLNMCFREILEEVDGRIPLVFDGLVSCPKFGGADTNFENFLSNLSVCPGMLSDAYWIRSALDGWEDLLVQQSTVGNSSILLSGSNFLSAFRENYLVYLLALSVLTGPGIFDVAVDLQNALVPLLLIKKYDAKLYEAIVGSIGFEPLGTLIKAQGTVECLLHTDVGTSQFFDIEDNSMFFVPLGEGTNAKVFVKNQNLGQVETLVCGGRLGLIVDTRGVADVTNLQVWKNKIEECLVGF